MTRKDIDVSNARSVYLRLRNVLSQFQTGFYESRTVSHYILIITTIMIMLLL